MTVKIVTDTAPGIDPGDVEAFFRSGMADAYAKAHADIVELQSAIDELVAPLLSVAERANIAQVGIMMKCFPEGSKAHVALDAIQQRKLTEIFYGDEE